MARATKWTDEKIKAVRPSPGKLEERKLVAPGLYLFVRARADGSVSRQWQYRAQVDGKRRWLSLGQYPAVGLAKATSDRLKHDSVHKAALMGESDHPVQVAQAQRQAVKDQPSVGDTFGEWIADKRLGSRRKGGKPVRESTIQTLNQVYEFNVERQLGKSKVGTLTSHAIQACIDGPRKRGSPGAAAHVYRLLRGLIRFAIARGYITGADPMRAIDNPAPYRPAPPNAAGDDTLAAFMRAINTAEIWPVTLLSMEFQLLTGARPGEVRLAQWSQIDLTRATWTIPAELVKTDREFRIHLSAQTLAVLKQAKTLKVGGVYVFPGAESTEANDTPLEKTAVARALRRIAERNPDNLGVRLKPHDLRKTFRTMLSRIGIAPHIAELCLNHLETQTLRRVYDGHNFWPEMVAAWDRAGAHLASLRAGGAVVIPIASKALRA